jgi:hypothetical protein
MIRALASYKNVGVGNSGRRAGPLATASASRGPTFPVLRRGSVPKANLPLSGSTGGISPGRTILRCPEGKDTAADHTLRSWPKWPVAAVLTLTLLMVTPIGAAGGGTLAPASSHLATRSATVGSPGPVLSDAGAPSLPNASGSSDPSPAAWTNLTSHVGLAPSPRWLSSMVYDPVSREVLLFGGADCPSLPCASLDGDTWVYSDFHWTQLSPPISPSPRYAASMAWDALDGYAVLFGGFTGSMTLNDTWTFQNGTWTNITSTTNQTPGSRWRAAMTYDAGDGEVLMFGGTNYAGTAYSDTWAFSGGHWRKLSVSGSPPGRYRASMAYDTAGNETVLFGGCTASNCPDSSTWIFHNATWKQISPTTHPSSRTYYYEAYFPANPQVLLFGGATESTTATFNDLYGFSQGNWTDESAQVTGAPSDRAYGMMVDDPADGYVLLFGGATESSSGAYTYFDQTWALGPPIVGALSIQPTRADVGLPVSINDTPYNAPSNISYIYSSLPPGCAPANLSVLSCRPNTTGTFHVSVTLRAPSGFNWSENGSLVVESDPVLQRFSVVPANVTMGTPISFSATVGGGSPPYQYTFTGLPPGCTSADRAVLNCTPTQNGTYRIELTVTDSARAALTGEASLVVHPRPSLPALLLLPPEIDLGMTAEIVANVSGGTAPFSYEYLDLPSGCISANQSILNCTPTALGTSLVRVVVTDAFGWSANATGVLTVNPPPSIFSFTSNLSVVDVGIPVALSLSVQGGTGALEIRFQGAPPGCSLSNTTSPTCTPTSPGRFTIDVVVRDAVGESTNASIILTVTTPPEIVNVAATPSVADVGDHVKLRVDVQGGAPPLRFMVSGEPAGCGAFDPNGTATCTVETPGTYSIQIQIADRWHSSPTAALGLTVAPQPRITDFAASLNPVPVGRLTMLMPDVVGGSGEFSFVYTGLPPGCTSSNSSALSCRPTQSGVYTVTVRATDTTGTSASAQLNLTVASLSTGAGGGVSSLVVGTAVGGVVAIVAIGVGAVLLLRRRRRR